MSEDDKTPAEQAVEHAFEVLVYAPIGLLFEGASLLPELIEKGRSQVTMARMMGQFALQHGRSEATKAVSKLQDQAAGLLDFVGDSVAPLPPDAAPAARVAAPRAATVTRAKAVVDQAIDAGSLAIPDYDGLSASHVVNRLAGLTKLELEAVQRYESARRGRKTILSKVAQLQG